MHGFMSFFRRTDFYCLFFRPQTSALPISGLPVLRLAIFFACAKFRLTFFIHVYFPLKRISTCIFI